MLPPLVVPTVTVVSVSFTIASSLALDARRNRLISALDLSEHKCSTCGAQCFNWRVSWYVQVDIVDTDPSLLTSMLGRCGHVYSVSSVSSVRFNAF